MFFKTKLNALFLALLALAAVSGCSGRNVDENNAQSVYEDAAEDMNDKRYVVALEKMKNVKNRFPYSGFAKQAQLSIADIEYLQENYIESAAAYETFRDLYPKYERADYVLFRIGESYYNQMPDTEARDLAGATKAIQSYEELRKVYPKSQYSEQASERMKDATDRLAKKEKYIGDFYYIRGVYDSATRRYERVVTQFAGSSVDEDSYARWARSLQKLDKNDEARHVWKMYAQRYPSGKYASRASKESEEN